jgi:hypothetical protein
MMYRRSGYCSKIFANEMGTTPLSSSEFRVQSSDFGVKNLFDIY